MEQKFKADKPWYTGLINGELLLFKSHESFTNFLKE